MRIQIGSDPKVVPEHQFSNKVPPSTIARAFKGGLFYRTCTAIVGASAEINDDDEPEEKVYPRLKFAQPPPPLPFSARCAEAESFAKILQDGEWKPCDLRGNTEGARPNQPKKLGECIIRLSRRTIADRNRCSINCLGSESNEGMAVGAFNPRTDAKIRA